MIAPTRIARFVMTKLTKRKSTLVFETNSTKFEKGRRRPICIEADFEVAYVRLKGMKHRFAISWEDVYDTAAKREADRVRSAKLAKKSVKR